MATEKWSSKPNFTTYLGNAATLASLLLGLVAIFYAYISSDSLSRGLGGITAVSKEIEEARNQILGFIQQTSKINQSVLSSKESLDQSKDRLDEDLGELRLLLQEVRDESKDLSATVCSIPIRLDKVESGIDGLTSIIQAKQDEGSEQSQEDPSREEFATEFLTRSSLDVNLLIIALAQSASSNKSFTVRNLATVLPGSRALILGQILLLYGVNLVAFKIEGTSDEHWSDKLFIITNVPSVFNVQAIIVYQSKLSEPGKMRPEIAERHHELLKSVLNFFAL